MMKAITHMIFLLIFTSCATQKNTKIIDYNDISISLVADKTHYKSNRWVKLYFVIKNHSNQDITILKPSTVYGNQMDFFSVEYQCEEETITEAPLPPFIKKTEADLVTVKSNSEIALELKGIYTE